MDEQTQMIHDEMQDEMLRQEIEATQGKLAAKLGALSEQVSEAVQTAAEAVEETVERVKETAETATETVQSVAEGVGETVQSVGETFNLRLHVERHPFLAVGAAVAAGFLAYRLLAPPPRETAAKPEPKPEPKPASSPEPVAKAAVDRDEGEEAKPQAHDEGPSWLGRMAGRLKSAAVDSVSALLSEAAENSLPPAVGRRVAQEIRAMTSDVGV